MYGHLRTQDRKPYRDRSLIQFYSLFSNQNGDVERGSVESLRFSQKSRVGDNTTLDPSFFKIYPSVSDVPYLRRVSVGPIVTIGG